MSLFGGPPNVENLKAKQDIKGLIKALNYQKDASIRQAAAVALGQLQDKQAVEPLITALGDQGIDVRRAAADALGRIGDARAVEPLITALNELLLRLEAANALGKLGDARAVEPLVTALEQQGTDIWRQAVAEALTNIGDTAVNPLIAAFKHPMAYVRQVAADTLGRIGDIRAVEPLLESLADNDPMVRRAAVQALGKIGDKSIAEWLVMCLTDSNIFVRESVVKVLNRFGWRPTNDIESAYLAYANREWDYLVRLGKSTCKLWEMALSGKEKEREEARRALEKTNDIRATELLLSLLSTGDDAIRQTVVSIFAQTRDTRAVAPLVVALKDSQPAVRRAAADALGTIGDTQAVAPLVIALKDSQPAVREAVADALGTIGNAQAVESLLELLKDTNLDVRVRGLAAIERLGWVPRNQNEDALAFVVKRDHKIHILNLNFKEALQSHSIDRLKSYLRFEPADIFEDNLFAVTKLPRSVLVTLHDVHSCGNWDDTYTYQADCSQVIQLARQELIRRGKKV